MRLRDFTPRGYQARHILILIVPMLIFVVSMTLFFFANHVSDVNAKLSRSVAQEIELLLDARQEQPEEWPFLVESFRNANLMDVTFRDGVKVLTRPEGRACCDALGDELFARIDAPYAYASRPDGMMTIRVLTAEGLLEATLDRKRVVIITAHIFIVWTALFCAFLLATSYAFLRNQVRSITRLADAADAFGRGEDAPSFRPSGAREVRQAARSIIRMRNRIRRFTDQRAAMLAGVSHDLRTPITRLKLEIAMMPKDIDTAAMKADIHEMERMLDGYLAFARGDEGEQPVDSDLARIAADACEHLKSRVDLRFEAQSQVQMRLRPLGLKRAISNLTNNAADHGDVVRVTVWREPESAFVSIEDNGPGIPDDQYADAFRPFSRLDSSRNQNVSGVGLGLTIARDTARAHGGDVTLGRSDLGGLKAVIRLPMAPNDQLDARD